LASDDEDRLLADKFRNYNSLIRPVEGLNASPIVVNFGLAMILLINVDEKNQIMQTNVWLTMRWRDYQLTWEPELYGHIKTIRIPPDKMCTMTFGSWTYNQNEVQLNYLDGKDQVELNDYSHSGIWDIMDVPGQLSKGNSEIKFHIHIRRKTLFYTVILIIPTVLMAFLSMMVFYLPADASEKITLAISILLALVVFLLLVSKILPPTSSTIPLMAKYLLLTFVMNVVTILVTVVIINVYFRGPSTHRMPQWARSLFLNLLPR
uniref:Nicotinic acetylcholine receptor beta 1 subunit n=1 Tax=Romanomermis culicivorax TaxID=13658 RepID=A0A915IB32_ROMCU